MMLNQYPSECRNVISRHETTEYPLNSVEIVMEHIDMESLDLSVLGKDEIEEIDLEEDIEMETIVVERDDDRSIKFKGKISLGRRVPAIVECTTFLERPVAGRN